MSLSNTPELDHMDLGVFDPDPIHKLADGRWYLRRYKPHQYVLLTAALQFILVLGELSCNLITPWDDDFNEMIDQWSPELRHWLLSAFVNQRNHGGIDIACRYTALQTYDKFYHYLTDIKGDVPVEVKGGIPSADGRLEPFVSKPQSVQVMEDLRFLVDVVRVQDITDWRTLRWEIANSCLIDGKIVKKADKVKDVAA